MAIAVIVLLFFLLPVKAQELTEKVRDFFNREGYVVKVEGSRAIVDLGRGKAFKGEEFEVFREGRELLHPITKQVIGRERQRVGRIRIEMVEEGFSYATLLEGAPREGDRVKLAYRDVCLDGSEELLYKLRAVLPELKQAKECTYMLKELKDGLGIEFKGSPLAFLSMPAPSLSAQSRATLEDINLLGKAKFIKALPSLPLSADICDLTGTGKEFLVVLYQSKVEVYELLKNDLVKRSDYSLPAGVGVGLSCGRLTSSQQDYVLVSMVSGDSANSLILKAVGDSLVPVARNIPYYMTILDKKRPKETFIGQRFNFRDKFGQTVRLSFEGESLKELGAFLAPRGFRADSAFYFGEYLVFTDSTGRIRVFKADGEVFSTEEGFDGSYTLVEIPLEQGKINFIFNPRGAVLSFMGFNMALVPKNQTGVVQKFLDVVKYSRGELFFIGERRKDLLFIKNIRGSNFEESIQTVLTTKEGRVLVLTGRTGVLTIQNRGDLYELELRVL